MAGTSITANTPGNLFFRTGTVTFGGESIGATEGNIVFSPGQEFHIPELAGATAEVVGTRHIIKEEPTLRVTMVEWQVELLANIILGVSLSSNASSAVIGYNDTVGCVDDSYYKELVFEGTQCDGTKTKIVFPYAIVNVAPEITFNEAGHATYEVTFKGCVSPDNPTARAWYMVKEL